MNNFLTEKNITKFIPLLQQYLEQQGWHKVKENDVLSIWNKVENPSLAALLRLPNITSHATDNVEFTLIALRKLADYLNSSVTLIVQAIYDSKPVAQLGQISIRVIADDVKNGQIAFHDGIELFKSTKRLVENFAKSTWKKSAQFSSYKPDNVLEFMNTVKLGQTQQGSYVVNVYYPIEQPTVSDEALLPTTSFSELVSQNMASGLAALSSYLSGENNAPKSAGDFVQKGISTNLCGTLISLSGKNRHRDVEVTLHASHKQEENQIFLLPKNKVKRIASISEQLAKDEYWLENFTLVGKVIERHSLSGGIEEGGRITVKAEIFGKGRNIHIELCPEDYKLANKATNSGKPLHLIGKLYVKQQKGEMTDLTKIQIWENEQLPI